jgi:3-polyprenyl-4-hydroxybenzoate decarboxylase
MLEYQTHRSFPDFRGISLVSVHCSILSRKGASGIPGVIQAAPVPAFRNSPETVDDIVNHSVGRVLDSFGLDSGAVSRWEGRRR